MYQITDSQFQQLQQMAIQYNQLLQQIGGLVVPDTILVTPENYDTLNQRTYKGVKCWKNKDYNRAAQARDAI
ncbi:MAG: hypothetical protein LBO08_02170, partial [Rickettsiales bacterium]|nr:hypothetical protein [Rickettsiales bacterium]